MVPTMRDKGISIVPPRGGKATPGQPSAYRRRYFNPPSPRGEGLFIFAGRLSQIVISIHPPRGGRDQCPGCRLDYSRISIHPPRKGRDDIFFKSHVKSPQFQSTLPARGGTTTYAIPVTNGAFQSTLPVGGGTEAASVEAGLMRISIHPPRVGRDHPATGALTDIAISIHPPRGGRD